MIWDRFAPYRGGLLDYALTSNGISYIQRAGRKEKQSGYVMPSNVTNAADYLELLIKRGIFVDLLTDQEVCNMTMAQFSREDILRYQGREEGEMIGAVRTCHKQNVPQETARHGSSYCEAV